MRTRTTTLYRKWAKQNTSLIVSAITPLAALAAVGIVTGVLSHRAHLSEAEQRAAADGSFRVASQIIDSLLSRATHDQLYQDYLAQAQVLATNSTNSYEELLSHNDVAELRFHAAVAYHNVARVWGLVGNHEKAIAACRRGIELLGPLVEAHPQDGKYLNARAACFLTLGGHMWNFGSLNAEEPYYQAAADYQLLVDRFSNRPAYQSGLAYALGGMATLSWSKGRFELAEEYFAEADQLLSKLPDTDPDLSCDSYVLSNKGTVLMNEALVARDRGDAKKAQALIDQVTAIHKRILSDKPGDPQPAELLFQNYSNLGDASIKVGEPAAAASTAEMLVGIFPERLDAYRQAATVLIECARLADQAAVSDAESQAVAGKNRDTDAAMSPSYDGHVTAQNYRLRAEELIAKARHVDDHNPDSIIDFALFLLLCKHEPFRDSERALELAQDVVKDYPEHGRAWFALALAQYRRSDWQAAITADENSMKFSHNEKADKSIVYDWLLFSMIRFQQGRVNEAHDWKTKAEDSFTGNKSTNTLLLGLAKEAKALVRNRDGQHL